jgi:hypothetical protein
MPTPEAVESKRRWAEGAQQRLLVLTDAVTALRGPFESGSSEGVEPKDGVDADVVAAAAALTQWLGACRAPRGLGKAEAELAAIAGVYRNAAIAYGSLSDADPEQRSARLAACARLLQQGDHHVEIFVARLRAKLGDS